MAAALVLGATAFTGAGASCLPPSYQCPTGQKLECYPLVGQGITAGQCCSCVPVQSSGGGAQITPGDQEDGERDDDKNWLLPGIVLGVAALAAVNHYVNRERQQDRPADQDENVRRLVRDGPQLPVQFNMSAFGVRGLIKGGWPIVVDYEQATPGKVQLQISIPGEEVVSYRLDRFGLGRHLLQFSLPDFLGNQLKPAIVALTASRGDGSYETLEGFKVFGVGVGPRAVGSKAIDRVEFAPETVIAGAGDRATFAFHSLSDFDNASVEFMQVTQSPDGIRTRYANGRRIDGGVRGDAWVGRDEAQHWDGHDERGRVSRGRHQLQVRVWDRGGDWLGAWSDSLVQVR
jgi:hypothetical protein